MLGEVAEDEIGGNGSYLVEAGFTELALNVELLGEAKATVGLKAGFRRLPARLGRQHLCHVRLGTRILLGLIAVHRLVQHQFGGSHPGIGLGDRELDALVLADRSAEDLALAGVAAGLFDEPLGVTMHSAAIRILSAFMPERM